MKHSELLFQLFCNLKALYQKNLKLPNISFQQILSIANIDDDGVDMSSLSKILGVDNSTGTRLIDGLEKKGLVKRVRSEIDNRIVKISLLYSLFIESIVTILSLFLGFSYSINKIVEYNMIGVVINQSKYL